MSDESRCTARPRQMKHPGINPGCDPRRLDTNMFKSPVDDRAITVVAEADRSSKSSTDHQQQKGDGKKKQAKSPRPPSASSGVQQNHEGEDHEARWMASRRSNTQPSPGQSQPALRNGSSIVSRIPPHKAATCQNKSTGASRSTDCVNDSDNRSGAIMTTTVAPRAIQ